MLLSICCITYNHAPFIGIAVENFLQQRTNFEIEVIIYDDASTDGTSNMVEDYSKNYPGIIKSHVNTKNKGMLHNFVDALQACSGKYLALCEGDDYWTDPLKLQKQVDFLEAHPECALCHHLVQGLKNGELTHKLSFEKSKQNFWTYPMEELTNKNFIYTSSVVFRREVLDILPPWFSQLTVGDYPLFLFAGKIGNYAQLFDYMSVYRTQGGIWSDQSRLQKAQTLVRLLSKLHEGFADMPLIQARLLQFLLKQAEIVRQSGSTAAEEYVQAALPAFAKVFPAIMDEYAELKTSAAGPPSFQQLKKGFSAWVKGKMFSR